MEGELSEHGSSLEYNLGTIAAIKRLQELGFADKDANRLVEIIEIGRQTALSENEMKEKEGILKRYRGQGIEPEV